MSDDPVFVKCGKFASVEELYRDTHLKENEKEMLYETVMLFDTMRNAFGKPIRINSGRRSHIHQLELGQQGFRTATTSPHEYGVAIDVDVPDGLKDIDLVEKIKFAAWDLGLPTPRTGYIQYRESNPDPHYAPGVSSSFVHYDFAFMLSWSLVRTLPAKAQKYWMVKGLVW